MVSKELWSDETGAGMVEYALLVALIALPLIGAIFPTVRDAVEVVFTRVQAAVGN
jgi:Flp pilus assembly pilin Flp